jgi:anti-anti-sigma factor
MVHYSVEDSKLVCSFSHRLDSANCAKWQEQLMQKVKESKMPVVFDMEKVNYIASVFLRICLAVAKEIGADNLTVVKTSDYVKKVFRVSGFDKKIKIK